LQSSPAKTSPSDQPLDKAFDSKADLSADNSSETQTLESVIENKPLVESDQLPTETEEHKTDEDAL
jgi:hypothetical protein